MPEMQPKRPVLADFFSSFLEYSVARLFAADLSITGAPLAESSNFSLEWRAVP